MGEWWADFLGDALENEVGQTGERDLRVRVKSGHRPLLVTSLVGTRFCSMKTLSVPFIPLFCVWHTR